MREQKSIESKVLKKQRKQLSKLRGFGLLLLLVFIVIVLLLVLAVHPFALHFLLRTGTEVPRVFVEGLALTLRIPLQSGLEQASFTHQKGIGPNALPSESIITRSTRRL